MLCGRRRRRSSPDARRPFGRGRIQEGIEADEIWADQAAKEVQVKADHWWRVTRVGTVMGIIEAEKQREQANEAEDKWWRGADGDRPLQPAD